MLKPAYSLHSLVLALLVGGCDVSTSSPRESPSPGTSDTSASLVVQPGSPVATDTTTIHLEPSQTGTFQYRFERLEYEWLSHTRESGDILYVRSADGSVLVTAHLSKDSVELAHPGEDSVHTDTTLQLSGLSDLIGTGYSCDDASVHCLDTSVSIAGSPRSATLARQIRSVGEAHQLALPGIGLIETTNQSHSIRYDQGISTSLQLISIDGNPI